FLQEKQLHLDAFYLVEKLRDACEIVQRSRLMKTVLPADPMLDFLLEKLSTDATILDAQPVVATYLFLYKLLISSGLGDFKKCLETVQENERLLNREAAQGLYNTLQNYCIEQINRGDTVFLREIFKIYQLQLHSKLLLEEGVLPEWHYKNIVTTALRLEERQWARDFIEAYRKHLAPAAADNAYRFNLAAYFYHIGEASKVLPLLVQVEYTDLRYNLDAKALLLRTYFDLSEEEALLAHVEAFTQFVKRNKSLTEFQKKGYFNLIKLTQRAFKLNLQKDFLKPEKWQEQFGKLAADLKSAEPVFNRSWLVLKLEMLKE
ncbi:MAG: hypothetical protein MUC59_09525, partial [Saprospiraceae bacterium]|nr:hypothetical protein [Saprospiraceae bacterium]